MLGQGCALTVTEERTDTVAHLAGALDAQSAPSMRDALLFLSEAAAKEGWLVVDLWSVSVLDPQGARLLAALARRAYASGLRVRLRAPLHHLKAVTAAAATHPYLQA